MRSFKPLIVIFLLSLISQFSYADDCSTVSKDSSFETELSEECKKHYIGDETGFTKIYELLKPQNNESAIKKLSEGNITASSSEFSTSEINLKHAVLIISALVTILVLLVAAYKVIDILVLKARGKQGIGDIGAKLLIKILFHAIWVILCVYCISLGISSLALTLNNSHIATLKRNADNPQTYTQENKRTADRKVNNEIDKNIDYWVCVNDVDRQILRQEAIYQDTDSKLKLKADNDYLRCMQEKPFAYSDDKNVFVSKYLHTVKTCAFNSNAAKVVKCGSVNFKNEHQQIIKQKFIDLDDRMAVFANELVKYYCSNQTLYFDKLQNYCFEYDPLISSIKTNGNNEVQQIKSSKSWAELSAEKDAIKAEISAAYQETQAASFKEFEPKPEAASFLDDILSMLIENSTIREARELQSNSLDYDFNYTPNYRYNLIDSATSAISNVVSGSSKAITEHAERIEDMVKDLTALPDEQVFRDFLFKGADFVGSDLFSRVGYDKSYSGDYNVLSAALNSTVSTAKALYVTSGVTYTANAVYSLYGSKSVTKPNLKNIAIEKTLSAVYSLSLSLALILTGVAVSIVIILIKSIVNAVQQYVTNAFKITTLADIPFLIRSIDDHNSAKDINDVVKRLMCLVYLLLAPQIYLLTYQAAQYITYMGFQILKENFFYMNISAGFYTGTSSTIFVLVTTVTTMALINLALVVCATKAFNESVNMVGVFIGKLFGASDNASGMFLQELNKFGSSSNNMFGQMSKLPNSIRKR